jgi:hypothetical protein
MRAIVLVGQIDEQRQLPAGASIDLPPGQVRLVVRMADEDEAGASWSSGISEAWRDQLSDPRQDIAPIQRRCCMLGSWLSLHGFDIGFRQNPIQIYQGLSVPRFAPRLRGGPHPRRFPRRLRRAQVRAQAPRRAAPTK